MELMSGALVGLVLLSIFVLVIVAKTAVVVGHENSSHVRSV